MSQSESEQTQQGMHFSSLAEVTAFVDTLPRRPHGTTGKWTAAQIVYHLATAIEVTSQDQMRSGSGFARLLKWPLRAWVLRRGLPQGVRIPAAVREQVTPPVGLVLEEAIARLHRAVAAFGRAKGQPPKHPVLGPLTHAEWERFHLRHAENHLQYIRFK